MAVVNFGVIADVRNDENVYVVGNCDELGQWNHERAIKMSRCNSDDQSTDVRWSVTLEINSIKKVEYRYFVGRMMCEPLSCDMEDECGILIVQWWEGGPAPREVYLADQSNLQLNDVFGMIGDGSVRYPGWLTRQEEVRLVFGSSSFTMYDRKAQQMHNYRIRCLPLNAGQEHQDAQNSTNEMLYLDLAEEVTEYRSQPEFGVSIKPDSIITFRMQTISDWNLLIHIFIYQELPGVNGELPLFGHAIVLPANLRPSSTGILQLPVYGTKLKLCGQLTLDYVVIKPLRSYKCTMASSQALEWRRGSRMLYVGHRGMGICRTSKHAHPHYSENTIQSFTQAAFHGADFVEFDVQLTKDLVPVIFHDFNCRLSCTSFSGAQQSSHDVAVMSLTYDKLKNLKIGFSAEGAGSSLFYQSGEPAEGEDNHLFPTVMEALKTVDPQLGFNIEVKYPMKLETGELEDGLQTFMDMNDYLDVLLENILPHTGKRIIVFTAFNPDVCTMLRLKQNQYPVSLLTQGKTERYTLYKDERTHDIHKVLRLAKAEHFLGVNPITEYILKDPTLVREAHDLDLILIPWGAENQDKDVGKQLKEQGVHGMIIDNIHEVMEAVKCEENINNNL